ncbi:MAG: hypothetical protein ACR2OA_12880, partial [Rubripirellula sp.]
DARISITGRIIEYRVIVARFLGGGFLIVCRVNEPCWSMYPQRGIEQTLFYPRTQGPSNREPA